MADVTILGSGGSTVTIGLTSQQNAAAAQLAAGFVSSLVSGDLLDQVIYPGTGTIPTPANILGGAIVTGSTPANPGALTAQFVSTVVNTSGPATVVGPQNDQSTVIAGNRGLTYLNLSAHAQIFLGNGNNGIFNASVGATAQVRLDGTAVLGPTAGITGTSTTVTAYDGSIGLINNPGENNFAVNADAGAAIVVGVQGAGTVPATVTGNGNSAIQYLAIGGSAYVNPTDGDVTVFGNVGEGTVTVFGGIKPIIEGGRIVGAKDLGPDFTGKLTVVNGRGMFYGGSGGGNLMFTDTIDGAATLVGGGNGDLLFSQGAGAYLVAGAGSETLSGFSNSATVGGATFFSGSGNATVFGNSGGGNIFGLGDGLTLVDGRNEARIAADNWGSTSNSFFVTARQGGGIGISDFDPGFDVFLMGVTDKVAHQQLATLTYYQSGTLNSPFGDGTGTRMILTAGTIVDFFGVEVKVADLDFH